MVLRADPLCSWHYMLGNPNVPATAFKVSIDGEGGYYDLCKECDTALLGPLRAMRAGKLVRAVRLDPLPEGWVASAAWPDAPSSAVKPGTLMPRKPVDKPMPASKPITASKPIGAGNGKLRKGHPSLFCPVVWCKHAPLKSHSGVDWHIRHAHPGLTITKLLDHLTQCGLCERNILNTVHMGRHVADEHGNDLDIDRKGAVLALIGAVRRAGDPHGTLKAMDAYALSTQSAQDADPQLLQGETIDDQPADQPSAD